METEEGANAGEPPAFDRLWAAYPRKQRRDEAEATWQEVRDGTPPLEDLLSSIRLWAQSDDWRKDGGKYVPRLARWLRERRWRERPPIPDAGFGGIPPLEVRELVERLGASLGWSDDS